jgi:hypothetical protein
MRQKCDPTAGSTAKARSPMPMGNSPGWTLSTMTPWRRASWARFSENLATAAFDTE